MSHTNLALNEKQSIKREFIFQKILIIKIMLEYHSQDLFYGICVSYSDPRKK